MVEVLGCRMMDVELDAMASHTTGPAVTHYYYYWMWWLDDLRIYESRGLSRKRPGGSNLGTPGNSSTDCSWLLETYMCTVQ